jgi:hypothetical protein
VYLKTKGAACVNRTTPEAHRGGVDEQIASDISTARGRMTWQTLEEDIARYRSVHGREPLGNGRLFARKHGVTIEEFWQAIFASQPAPAAPVAAAPVPAAAPIIDRTPPSATIVAPTPELPATADAQHPFDRVLAALRARGSRVQANRDRHGRESVRAQCPAHDDRRASLTVTRDGNKVLVMCWAGCTSGSGTARVQKVADALGLKPSDFCSGPWQSLGMRRVRVATYDYHAFDGTLLGQKDRWQPKAFTWRRGYSPECSLYHLLDLRDTQTVFLTEGEKACDRLWEMRIAATCGAGGAGRWLPEWSLQLWMAGCRELIIVPDMDVPGKQHAEAVAAITSALDVDDRIQVKILNLPGLVAKGADIADWLDAGHDEPELFALAAETPAWTPQLANEQRRQKLRDKWKADKFRQRRNRRLLSTGVCQDDPARTDVHLCMSGAATAEPCPPVHLSTVCMLSCTSQTNVLRDHPVPRSTDLSPHGEDPFDREEIAISDDREETYPKVSTSSGGDDG